MKGHSITAFLWDKWFEEDADGMNLLIITPKRQLQESSMIDQLSKVAPVETDENGNATYTIGDLEAAWHQCTQC